MCSFSTLCFLTFFFERWFYKFEERCDHCCNDIPLIKRKANTWSIYFSAASIHYHVGLLQTQEDLLFF